MSNINKACLFTSCLELICSTQKVKYPWIHANCKASAHSAAKWRFTLLEAGCDESAASIAFTKQSKNQALKGAWRLLETHSRTSRWNCFCLFPRNSPIICLLKPFLWSRKWATPTGVSGTKLRSIRYWMPFSGFLERERENYPLAPRRKGGDVLSSVVSTSVNNET